MILQHRLQTGSNAAFRMGAKNDISHWWIFDKVVTGKSTMFYTDANYRRYYGDVR